MLVSRDITYRLYFLFYKPYESNGLQVITS